MWGPIIQFLTLFGGGVAVGKILEEQQPVIVQTVPVPPQVVQPAITTATTTPGTISPWLIIAIAILVFAAGYVIRVFRKDA